MIRDSLIGSLNNIPDLIDPKNERWSDRRYIFKLKFQLLLLRFFTLFHKQISSFKIINEAEGGINRLKFSEPVILAVWHRDIILMAARFRGPNILSMASNSKDGDLVTAFTLRECNSRMVRGSSSRGGVAALVGALKTLKSGKSILITVDGPRGPVGEPKPGAVMLAKKTGVPLVPCVMASSNSFSLNSWDKTLVAFPFSKNVYYCGPKFYISETEELETSIDLIKKQLSKAKERADLLLAEKLRR
ncbi:MAG: lysophospholipid acyltransferase family protein [Candidatus Riflebacteria bacterium]|nr:lysophospholipid acyltransferase family protein [Candidatus Riflebacteria bacterium]